MDVFTRGKFIELPADDLDTDCVGWYLVFADALAYAHARGAIVGDETTVEQRVQEVYNRLIDSDCTTPP